MLADFPDGKLCSGGVSCNFSFVQAEFRAAEFHAGGVSCRQSFVPAVMFAGVVSCSRSFFVSGVSCR